jgi:P-type Cu+ transporter
MATDPICGMWVDERPSSLHLVRDNRTYYFCAESCLHQFSEPEAEQRRLLRRLAVAWPLAITVVVLTYAFAPFGDTLYAAAGLATVVQVYAGAPFYAGTRDAIRDRSWNMDLLIAVGTSAAFLYSLAALAFPSRLPHEYYFDASALILALILTGNYLEHLTRARAGSALRRLHELLPETSLVVVGGVERTVPVGELVPGDLVRLRPGGRFPVDGVVRTGATSVDESLLTGESTPVAKRPGSRVLAGSINGEGAVEVEASTVGADTFLAQIGRLLTESEMSRVPLKRTADRIAAVFVPTVLTLGLVTGILWYAWGGSGLTVALLVFVTVAVTACPCAFGIATPAAIVVGTGRAAENGILYRGENTIEQAALVDLVLTDKTGTLTRGRPSLTDVHPTSTLSETELLSLAASVETGSEHPLARAVVEAARTRGAPVASARDVLANPGVGVRGTVDGHVVDVIRVGRATTLSGNIPDGPAIQRHLESEGKTCAAVVRDGTTIGFLGFTDEVTPGVAEAVKTLGQDGIRVVLVTGDNEVVARAVAQKVGIAEVHSGVTPAGKLELIQKYRAADRHVAFVGDGINDAPALAGANVGIAIGSGTAVAREASGVILVRSDFADVVLALRLARRTVRKVRGNLTWAIGYNAVLLPVAMGALVPLFGFSIYEVLPIAGAVAMGLSSTTVVVNSLSLRWSSLGGTSSHPPVRATVAH